MSHSSKSIESNNRMSSQGFSTAKLKELVENEVYDILSGIKIQIQNKMKQVDRNINLLRTEVNELKKCTVMMKKHQSGDNQSSSSIIDESLKVLMLKVEKIQKEIIILKNSTHLNDASYIQNGQTSKSHISVYKVGQDEKSNSKQKTNSPLLKKSQLQGIDLNTLIFEDDKSNKLNSSSISLNESIPSSKTEKKTGIFTVPSSNMKKPPLPSTQFKPKIVPNQFSTSSSFYDQIQNYGLDQRKNAIIQQSQPQIVEQELSKNKNVFLRRKKSEQKIESPPPVQISSAHRFQNQLQDFGQRQDESFNIELQYSKDTFLSDL